MLVTMIAVTAALVAGATLFAGEGAQQPDADIDGGNADDDHDDYCLKGHWSISCGGFLSATWSVPAVRSVYMSLLIAADSRAMATLIAAARARG